MRNRREMLFVVLLFVMCTSMLMAQTTGKVSGTVTDAESGSPLIGANVILEGTSFGAATGLDGSFFIINVPPGIYNAKVSMMGYKTQMVELLRVSVNRTSAVNLALTPTVLETGEVVVVQAEKITVKKDQTGSIRNVSSADIEMLPVESTGAVVNMQAGVVQGRFRGGRSGEVSYMIDGMQVDNALDRGRGVDLDVDAVADLEVITGTFNAEYGRAMSGIVNVVSKEGSNKFHGSVSGYLAGYYTPNDDIWYGLESNINRNQDYKFSLDGPIIKDHLTFAINGRYQKNDNYLVGIRRFNVTDLSSYDNYPIQWSSEATGDSALVPMNNNEIWNMSAKLAWKMQNKKLSVLYVFNDAVYHDYGSHAGIDYHQFMYAPDGRRASYPRSHLTTVQWNHMFSQKAFYEAKFSYMNRYDGDYLYEDPLDPGYVSDIYLANQNLTGFYTGGQDKNHYIALSKRYDGKVDLTWQVNKNHAIKTGVLYTQHSFDQKNYQILNRYRNTAFETTYYKPEILPDSTIYSDVYMKEPVEAAFYIQDKMEFEEMVINLGVRYEYFDPATMYPTQLRNPGNLLQFDDQDRMSTYPDADVKVNISPRFGLSYQLGESALLRFSYGHFLQFPPFNRMYQNNSYVLGTTSYQTIIGYPQVDPEKTVNYELGYWQKLTSNMDCEVALFYKDIYDLSTVNMYNTYNNVWYGVYGNKDYGNVRGLEVKYNLYWNQIVVGANYTLQYTRGNADNPSLTFTRAGNNQDPIPTLIPLGWDQRHTANLTVGYNTKGYGLTATAYYGSGGVYTWAAIPENRLSRVNLYPNNAYKPNTLQIDLRGHYELMEIQGIKVRATLQVYNLLDKLNEFGVNQFTGRANQTIIRPEQILNHKADWVTYEERIFNQSAYSAPRQIKVGLEMRF